MIKLRPRPTRRQPEPQAHRATTWMFALEAKVALTLGERRLAVDAGEAAESSTMTPDAVAAVGGPAEVTMIFDRDASTPTSRNKLTDTSSAVEEASAAEDDVSKTR